MEKRFLKEGDNISSYFLEKYGVQPGTRLNQVARRPELQREDLDFLLQSTLGLNLSPEELSILQTDVRYSGYIQVQQREVDRMRSFEEVRIPDSIDYSKISGLSREMMDRLSRVLPATLGQASRIPGITPAAVSMLHIHLKRRS
jgi:tRNA uridine 5-carboxymethylaminomethyl modification enzyme